MTRDTIYRLAEVVGVLGIIGSLIFVGMEVRQGAAATRSATAAEFSAGFRELNLVIATNSELARIVATYGEDPTKASPVEQAQLSGLFRALFQTWASVHRQHVNGTLDPVLYETMVQQMVAYAGRSTDDPEMASRQRMVQWAWDINGFLYPDDFRALFDSILGGRLR